MDTIHDHEFPVALLKSVSRGHFYAQLNPAPGACFLVLRGSTPRNNFLHLIPRFIAVESEEVELSPCLRPLAQTARAVFPQAAFLYGRRAGVRSIVMPGTRLIKRMSPISVTSRRVGYLR